MHGWNLHAFSIVFFARMAGVDQLQPCMAGIDLHCLSCFLCCAACFSCSCRDWNLPTVYLFRSFLTEVRVFCCGRAVVAGQSACVVLTLADGATMVPRMIHHSHTHINKRYFESMHDGNVPLMEYFFARTTDYICVSP